MKEWVCENERCGWRGKRPATLTAGGMKIKVCQNCMKSCIHQENVDKRPQAIVSTEYAKAVSGLKGNHQ